MTDIALVTDHTEQALGLLISQYQGLPRLSGLIAAITNRLQELEDANWDVINKRLLDYTDATGNPAHAVAAQLDAIGRLVGRARGGQSDVTYLLYIRAQIFINKSRGLRNQVIQLLLLLDAAPFTYSEFYPCTVLLEYLVAPTADPNVLLDLAKKVVPGGVKLFLTAPPPGVAAANTFAFSNYGDTSDPARGFGNYGSTAYGGQLASEYA